VSAIHSATGHVTDIDLDAYHGAPDRQRIVSAYSEISRDRGSHRITQDEEVYGDPLPWAKTHRAMRFRPHEVSAWIGPNGDGKSLMLGSVAFGWALAGRRVLVVSLEMDIGTQVARMARQALCKSDINYDELDLLLSKVGLDLFFFDYVGQVSPTRIVALVTYAALRMKCAHVVIDNLTMIVPPGRNSDEEAARFTALLVQVARETGVHIHLVGHIRKPEDDRRLTRYDWRGTGACPDMVHNVLIVQGNGKKRRSEERGEPARDDPDHYLIVDKQRNGAHCPPFLLWFWQRSLSWCESPADSPIQIDLDSIP
jgi:twinkle protein